MSPSDAAERGTYVPSGVKWKKACCINQWQKHESLTPFICGWGALALLWRLQKRRKENPRSILLRNNIEQKKPPHNESDCPPKGHVRWQNMISLFTIDTVQQAKHIQSSTRDNIFPCPKPKLPYNVLGKRAGHASERVKIPPTLTSTINYTSKIGDIGKKQVAL